MPRHASNVGLGAVTVTLGAQHTSADGADVCVKLVGGDQMEPGRIGFVLCR